MHFSTAFALAFPAIALATAIPHDGGSCTTGPIQCCDRVQQASSLSPGFLNGLLGIDVGSITGLVGLTCNPISVIGFGGNSCSQQTVCCSNNSFNGVIALGCTPININV